MKIIKAYFYPKSTEHDPLRDQGCSGSDWPARRSDGRIIRKLKPPCPSHLTAREWRTRVCLPFRKPAPKPPVRFHWVTKAGEHLLPSDMATMHLFYAIRMIFNNFVPPAFRVGKFRRDKTVQGWPTEYKCEANTALLKELRSRDDLDDAVSDSPGDTIREQLADLDANAELIVSLNLNLNL